MERATVDLRLHVSADTRADVYAALNAFVESARAIAPPTIEVCYTQLRRGHPLAKFQPTMTPQKTRDATP